MFPQYWMYSASVKTQEPGSNGEKKTVMKIADVWEKDGHAGALTEAPMVTSFSWQGLLPVRLHGSRGIVSFFWEGFRARRSQLYLVYAIQERNLEYVLSDEIQVFWRP